jgi:hypothetical protein
MGIPPYMSPPERARIDGEIAHYKKFCVDKGYKNCYEYNGLGEAKPRHRFLSPEGIEYKTAEAFYKGHGCYPGYEKDGICYGLYEVGKIEGYVDPFYDEVAFLKSKGFIRYFKTLSDDYMENNNLLEKFYKEHGYVPRWEKDGQTFGHEHLLIREGYVYPFNPKA